MSQRPPTPEEAFQWGAEAMRTQCATLVTTKNQIGLAVEILTMRLPAFSPPEKVTLEGADAGEVKP